MECMLKVDKAIRDVDGVICENIAHFSFSDRGLLSQNVLAQIRNFVEYIAIKEYSNGKDVNPHDYALSKLAFKDIKQRGDLRFLYKFHEMLQKSVSHYTVNNDGAERLMLKYYEHLLKIKTHLQQKYGMTVLNNLNEFPLNTDKELSDYYEKIAERIDIPSVKSSPVRYEDRYYIQKIKPFFAKQKIYYEVTFTTAHSNTSKFDRVIAFTNCEIIDNYAVKFRIRNDSISILGKDMEILVIEGYQVSIRPCEWDRLSEIFGLYEKHSGNSKEYRGLMAFISRVGMSLTDLVCSDDQYYEEIKSDITENANSTKIFDLLDSCREIVIHNKPGANILRYLLYKMNNRVIKGQYNGEKCSRLSGLCLKYGCIPFDRMPYCSSLVQHNPKIFDLLDSIPVSDREHELFARFIKNNTEIEGRLFTTRDEIKSFTDIDALINKYNQKLYYKHTSRRIEEYKGKIYMKGYVEDSTTIIKKLQELSSSGVSQYTASVDSWMSKEAYVIDDDNKQDALRRMFADSRVALIYGAAGTGKSTLIRHVANFWADKDKIFLANTHPAVDNMRRKVVAAKSDYNTIAGFLSKKNINTTCDVLFIDECSTVSNKDMREVLEKATFKLLVLVGDVYQIESIYFGNWFSISQKFLPQSSVFNLKNPFRTANNELKTVWSRVRDLDDSILEPLVKSGYVARLDESIFEHGARDEIVLCLNYDGLYGINNINRFLQNNNPNQAINWGINTYKVGDPVLFNESNVFSPVIHNNSKGIIVGIRPEEQEIWFDIELEESINEIDACQYDFQLIGASKEGNSIISFSVNKIRSTDEDDSNDSTVVPFQVAYAVSIHKAQGLEYDSVKIVITNEIEERITHNIFYTAITRAKKSLMIYWSPETEQAVLESLEKKDVNKDAYLLARLSNMKMPC